jgi:hypothetical protein
LKVEDGLLSLGDAQARSEGLSDLWGLLRVKELQLIQRSRLRWLKEGDANTNYFHASVKGRCKKISILALRVGDRWVESVLEVRVKIVNYFTNHFSESVNNRPTLDGIEFQGVDPLEDRALTVPFIATEIEGVVLSSDGDKSPGPDGFNFSFFKSFWGLFKGEVGVLFDQFYVTANLPHSFSSYFITLIPKSPSHLSIGDFRPISLVGSLYKMVAKVLARDWQRSWIN